MNKSCSARAGPTCQFSIAPKGFRNSGRCNGIQQQHRDVAAQASFFDKVKDIWQRSKFENWAPKSSRAWRLRQYPSSSPQDEQQERVEAEDFASSLQQRISQLSADAQSVAPAAEPLPSFVDATDADLAASLQERLGSAGTAEASDSEFSDAAADAPLSAQELVQLVEAKYGHKYDMTIARRQWGPKDFVSLNIMWVHLSQRSFPMTEEEFYDKMDTICMLLNAWGKAGPLRAWLKQKPESKGGLPRRPIVGHAVAFQLDLPPAVVAEWIGNRLG